MSKRWEGEAWGSGVLRDGVEPEYADSRAIFCLTDAVSGASLLKPRSVHTIVTSPPYFSLRSYLPPDHPSKGMEIGGESELGEYISNLVAVFDALAPALRDDGTLWIVIGDTYGRGKRGRYSGDAARGANKRPGAWAQEGYGRSPEAPEKQLLGVPWRFAFAMQDSGWILRSDVIWIKDNALPQPVKDRPANSYEHVFLFSKRLRYYYDAEAVREKPASYSRKGGSAAYTANGSASHGVGSGSLHQMSEAGRNLRDTWRINPRAFTGAHYAPYPPELVFPCVKASTSGKGVCPSCGAPWRRVTETERTVRDSGGASPKRASLNTGGVESSGLVNNSLPETRTLGWEPGCECADAWDAGEHKSHEREPAAESPGSGERPQKRRARELFIEAGLTEAHAEAIRACGISDTGKALVTTKGAGANTEEMMRLADEARQALGGYYREFLSGSRATNEFESACGCPPADPEPAVVLDPFCGSGTTLEAARRLGRRSIGFDIDSESASHLQKRLGYQEVLF